MRALTIVVGFTFRSFMPMSSNMLTRPADISANIKPHKLQDEREQNQQHQNADDHDPNDPGIDGRGVICR